MPDCFRGEAETCWDAANESVSDSAETSQQHLGLFWSPAGHGSRTQVKLSRCKLQTMPVELANVTWCPLVIYSVDG